MRGFWNDPDGLTIDELAALTVLPLFLFVGIRLALAEDISSTQVDFFTVLTYPILAVVARHAIERMGWPALGKKGASPSIPPPSTYYPPEPANYTPRDDGNGDGQPATGDTNKPTI